MPSLSSEYVAKYAVNKMFKNKTIIIPGTEMKLGIFFSGLLTKKTQLKILYNIQKKKMN
jgi:short-subunit dehydrogenase